MGKKFGFSFSARRASGLSGIKGRISRKTGVPLTRSGRQRKIGRASGCCVAAFIFLASLAVGGFFLSRAVMAIPVYSAEWYEGGNLHQATVKTWRQSTYNNRLATAADWFVSITKSHNPNLKKNMDNLSTAQYLDASKNFAVQLEKCVSDTASLNSKGRVFCKPNDKIAEIALICYTSMYGINKAAD